MLFLTRGGSGWRKAATAATATALAATTLAFASSPAQADAENPVLNWNISQNFINHFTANYGAAGGTITATDGATFASGAISFEGDTSTVRNGVTTLSYDGTVTGAFSNLGVLQYSVTVTDPEIEFNAAGNGEVRATVSGNVPGTATTTPAEVVVATFSAGVLAANSFSAIPDFDNVLPAGSAEALALGIPANQPLDGKSFNPAFLTNLPSGVRGHFYASNSQSGTPSSANVNKPVAGLNATFATPTPVRPSVGASATVNGDYVDVAVSGQDVFPDLTAQNYVDGVYVAFGEKRDIFDIDAEGAEDGAALFLATNHIEGSHIVDGVLSTVVAVDKTKLVRGKTYAIYTWTAHGNPKATDEAYTETEVDIPEAAFPPVVKKASATKIKVNKVPTTKKVGKATITVTGTNGTATGKVTFVLKKGKATKKIKAATLKKGKVAVKLPKLKKGKWKLTAKYAGSSKYKASSKTVTIKVKK